MTGIIILAAGLSKRLGRSKQILQYQDQSLLQRTIKAALDSKVGPVIVVIGANERLIRSHIENEAVDVVFNENYEQGIASSIHAGVATILKGYNDCHSVILMVCDQPHINPELLRNITDTKLRSDRPIVASTYQDTVGVPALFDKSLFPELLALTGEEGGKKILLKHPEKITAVPFPGGNIDIDTPADYQTLISGQ